MKFRQLWAAGRPAQLSANCQAGMATVSLRVQLGRAPAPAHRHHGQPQPGRRSRTKGAAHQRRKARREAEQVAVKAAEDERRIAEQEVEDERRIAEQATEDKRRIAEKVVEDERRIAEQAAEDERRIAEQAAKDETAALPLYPKECWHIGHRVVTGGDNDIVEILASENLVLLQVLGEHSEVVPVFVVGNILDDVAEWGRSS